jgi:hypothetical protein
VTALRSLSLVPNLGVLIRFEHSGNIIKDPKTRQSPSLFFPHLDTVSGQVSLREGGRSSHHDFSQHNSVKNSTTNTTVTTGGIMHKSEMANNKGWTGSRASEPLARQGAASGENEYAEVGQATRPQLPPHYHRDRRGSHDHSRPDKVEAATQIAHPLGPSQPPRALKLDLFPTQVK